MENQEKVLFSSKVEDISYKIQTSSCCSKQIFLPPFVRSLRVPFKSDKDYVKLQLEGNQ